MENLIMDYFKWESGSKIWPSDNPTDSPFDKFTCKKCNWSFKARVNGEFPIDARPWDEIKKTIVEHMAVRHQIRIPLSIF